MSLQLILSLEQNRINVESPVVANVVLRNINSEPLIVNGRLLFNDLSAPEEARDISFNINGPPDYFSLKVFHINPAPLGPEHFVELKPGECVERAYLLTKYYSLHAAGEYAIQAAYLNVHPHHAGGRHAWRGSVDSNWVRLERICNTRC